MDQVAKVLTCFFELTVSSICENFLWQQAGNGLYVWAHQNSQFEAHTVCFVFNLPIDRFGKQLN